MSAVLSEIQAGGAKDGTPPHRWRGPERDAARPTGPRARIVDEPRPARVLVIDDEIENLELVRRYLQRHFAVDTTPSPATALEMLGSARYDIIISDQRMPKMTGSRLLGESLRLAPDAVRIVITGYCDHDATIEAINVGRVSGYIQKPFAAQTLLDTINSQLEGGERTAGQERRERVQRVLDHLPDAHAVLGAGGVVYANQAMADLYRISSPELLYGRSLADLLLGAATDADWAIEQDAAVLARVEGAQVPVSVRRRVLEDAVILRLYHNRPAGAAAVRALVPKLRLLLVDSSHLMLRSLRRLLANALEVRCATNLEEACRLAAVGPPLDVIVAEAQLADGTAEELRHRLEELRPEHAPRLITMSDHASVAPEADGVPAALVLQKPFLPEELYAAMSMVLGSDRLRGANR